MASNTILEESLYNSDLDQLKIEVKEAFNRLHQKLDQRELFILNKIEERQAHYGNKLLEISQAVEELNLTRQYVSDVFKSNLLKEERNSQIITIEDKLTNLASQQYKITEKMHTELLCDTATLECLIAQIDIKVRFEQLDDSITEVEKKTIPENKDETPTETATDKKEKTISEKTDIVAVEDTDYTLIFKLNLTSHNKKSKIGSPCCLAIDERSGLFYITDSDKNEIQIWSEDGKFIRKFGDKILHSPFGICIDGDYIYITCTKTCHSLFKFNKFDELLCKMGEEGTDNNSFLYPRGLCAVHSQIYVCDSNNHRIQIFDSNLNYIRTISNATSICKPLDIKFHSTLIYILNFNSNRLFVFNLNDEYISNIRLQTGRNFINLFTIDFFGNILSAAQETNTIYINSPKGKIIKKVNKYLDSPLGICIGRNQEIICVCMNTPP